jgi:hypothetical protein
LFILFNEDDQDLQFVLFGGGELLTSRGKQADALKRFGVLLGSFE